MKHHGVLAPLIITFGLVALGVASHPWTVHAQPAGSPNIILIITDDLDTGYPGGTWIENFPRLQALLTDAGTTFSNAFVSLALCCPSRAAILRGQYAHNTDIFKNGPPHGGFQDFHALGHEESTIATWLQDAGYRTVLLGKYLNGYPQTVPQTYVPPGWSEWYAVVGGPNYFNYRLNENRQIVPYGENPEDYLTDVLSDKARDFVQRTASAAQPFFMYIAPYAPHQPATPAPRHAEAFEGVAAPRPPSFNEGDVSDKPQWVQALPRLTRARIAQIDALYRRRLQSMLAVEDLVENLVQMLDAVGVLENTYIVFTSDNGFHLGQHRQGPGKNSAYEEDVRVPLIVRGPGVPAGGVLDQLVVNIDYAPTFAELAGASAPEFVDGRSLVPLLGGDPAARTLWRQAFILESSFLQGPRHFQGLRTTHHAYVEYRDTDERELYDLDADPFELESIHETADPALVKQLAAWLDTLRACAGAECRAAEEAPPASSAVRSPLVAGE